MKDSANVRGIHQGLVLFAQSNRDEYPLPSKLDKNNATIALSSPNADPTEKDTTANIISVLIYSTFFGPEICISPSEINSNIVHDNDYSYEAPSKAVDPTKALWDPAFNADFTSKDPAGNLIPSNFSYAHILPSGPRAALWRNDFDANRAILGNRGPRITAITKGRPPLIAPVFDTASNTLRIHGNPTTWEGNIAFNDDHVNYESNLWADTTNPSLMYKDNSGSEWADLWHFDEPDDPLSTNAYLGIFNKAGPTPAAYSAIWD